MFICSYCIITCFSLVILLHVYYCSYYHIFIFVHITICLSLFILLYVCRCYTVIILILFKYVCTFIPWQGVERVNTNLTNITYRYDLFYKRQRWEKLRSREYTRGEGARKCICNILIFKNSVRNIIIRGKE